MAFKTEIIAQIDVASDLKKVDNDKLWLFSATEWNKLISKYVPMETGNLRNNVILRPKEIEYKSNYAHYLYKGILMVGTNGSPWAEKGDTKHYTTTALNYKKNMNVLASKEWDVAAKPTQSPKLITAMQKYIDSGKLGLSNGQ